MKNRRKSRELALQVLYAYELTTEKNHQNIFDAVAEIDKNREIGGETKEYARFIIEKTVKNISQTDALLQKHATNWDLKRMAVTDRNILRIAVCELRFSQNVPYKVIIDEAVEIAKMYGTDDSGKFVNGIIDAVYKDLSRNK